MHDWNLNMQVQCKSSKIQLHAKKWAPPKDHITPPNCSPPLASSTKRSSHPEAAAGEDRMAEGDRTVVVELVLGSSGRNDLWNPQKLC
jgi:hypothetical protein